MVYNSDSDLDRWIEEDLPYFDLTTHLLGIGQANAVMVFEARAENVVAACTEEASRLLTRCGAAEVDARPSGSLLESEEILVSASGTAEALNRGWKVAQNVLEYACGIATKTYRMLHAARRVNPDVMLFTTRKNPPGTRKLAIKSILAAGAYPHRLGLSESILVFDNHIRMMGLEALLERLQEQGDKSLEKRVVIEAKDVETARLLASRGVQVIQMDKFDPERLGRAVADLRKEYPGLVILAAGGITAENISEYAATGVDGLVSSSPYHAVPADIGVRMERVTV
jgi:molybdenum transport protein